MTKESLLKLVFNNSEYEKKIYDWLQSLVYEHLPPEEINKDTLLDIDYDSIKFESTNKNLLIKVDGYIESTNRNREFDFEIYFEGNLNFVRLMYEEF
jgi:hypothetical protein